MFSSSPRFCSTLKFGVVVFLVTLAVVCGSSWSLAEDAKKPEEPVKPKIVLAMPLGVSPGVPAKMTLRGLKLDAASEVKLAVEGVEVKIGSKGAAQMPDKGNEKDKEKQKEKARQDADKFGDSQIEIEFMLPDGFAGELVNISAVTPDGQTPPHAVRVVAKEVLIAEKEPNNGFKEAQKVERGQVVAGAIQSPRDVDVFAYEAKAGESLACEVLAARLGSPLDSILTIYDGQTHVIGTNDDAAGGHDSKLQVTFPADGVYYLVVLDAHDRGGPNYVYHLAIGK